MDHNQALDAIGDIVDKQENFAEFVEVLAEMCSVKADHVASNWQDETLEEIWNRRAAYLLNMSDAIEKSFA